MSISSEITRLANAKSAIASAISAKGVTVPSELKLGDMPALISAIEGGGGDGGKTITFIKTPTGISYVDNAVILCPAKAVPGTMVTAALYQASGTLYPSIVSSSPSVSFAYTDLYDFSTGRTVTLCTFTMPDVALTISVHYDD